ncbi:MAG: RNA methyltransferase [Clostridia bacterium]|nr:RNA methyltransferase [Clostridia bacterium]
MKIDREVIRSRQNRTVVEVGKLTDRKAREEARLFRFDGVKLFREALLAGLELPLVLLSEPTANGILSSIQRDFGEAALERVGRILLLSEEVFLKLSEEKSPEGVICVAKYIDKLQKNATIYVSDKNFSDPGQEKILLLEAVRDPSNLGAVVRSAAAFGVDRLILSTDCADIYHPKTLRASMGTLFTQRIDRSDDLFATIASLKNAGRRVFAAALSQDAQKLGAFEAVPGDCVVIGNEGHGLTENILGACDGCLMIPMTERAESLNAAVAASIFLWEFFGKKKNET